jgi:hypothetical protein
VSNFRINPEAKLPAAELAKLKQAFTDVDAEVAKAKALEKSAIAYFEQLEKIDGHLEKFQELGDDIMVVDGKHDREIYVDSDHPGAAAANLFGCWMPSSMEC